MLANNYAGAELAFRAVLAAAPGYVMAYKALGILYTNMNQPRRAMEMFKRYLAMAPKAPDADSIRDRITQLGGE